MQSRSESDIADVFRQIETAQKTLIPALPPEPSETDIVTVPSEFPVTRTTNFSSPERDESARLE